MSFCIFTRRGEKYSCYTLKMSEASFNEAKTQNRASAARRHCQLITFNLICHLATSRRRSILSFRLPKIFTIHYNPTPSPTPKGHPNDPQNRHPTRRRHRP
ncbi:hypothetical protein [Kingella sp. (in: b-proteobacteria)]|uniref:hypothetical protein n=1 Tax=Kingella sp. (in: b-proteobacteria) TaxID=2020713 RepID=UPI0026DC2E75|nr:hypothetical protein [Kingella sp. (in: b-proteobacteria)]MDO4657540.1 hypothetical protein [Kingella sp. (in: b-proteobacteria)]